MRVRERREIRSKTFFDILLHISSTIHMQEEEKNKKNKKQKTKKQTNKQRLLKWRKRKCRFSERDKQRRRKRA